MRYVYLILSNSKTVPARFVSFFTRSEISHAAIATDLSLRNMYSFGRKTLNNFLNSGFICEDFEGEFYTKFKNSYIYVFRIQVDCKKWIRVNSFLLYRYKKRDIYRYNFLGVFATCLGIPINRKNYYFCSEFVADVLDRFNIYKINRNIHTYKPKYFMELNNMDKIYEGKICDYKNFLESLSNESVKISC